MEEKQEKAAYFAQYLNQSVFNDSYGEYLYPLLPSFLGTIADGEFIQLTPLSLITDEDAIEVAKIEGCDYKSAIQLAISRDTSLPDGNETAFLTRMGRYYAIHCKGLTYRSYQHLQSKGYALPFRQYSVEQLIEMGWLKLTPPPQKKH